MSTRIIISLIVLAVLVFSPLAARADQTTILVVSFENQTADRNIDWIGEGLAELVVDRLLAERDLYVFGRDERSTAYERLGIPETVSVSRATAMKLGWDTGADKVITGRIAGTHDNFQIDARVIDLADASSSLELKVTGKLDDVIPMAASLSQQIARMLVPASVIPESDYISHPPVPRSAFEGYVRGLLTPDPQRRIDLLQDAIRLHPQYTAAIYQLGRAYHVDRNFKASSPLLEKIPASSPDYGQAQFMLGLNAYYLGDFAKAATLFMALPPAYDVLIDLGASLAGKGDGNGAIQTWKRASDLDPLGSEALFNMSYLSFTNGNAEAASKTLDQFLKLQGRDGEALFLQGRVYERLGRTDDGLRVTAQAIRLSPRVERWTGQPLPNLVRVRPQFNPMESRLPFLATIWTDQRQSRRAGGLDLLAWLDTVEKQMDSQLYGEALRELRDITRTFPDSADARVLMAQVYESQKQNDLAVREYQRAIQLKPAAESYVLLARLYRSMNQSALALQAAQEALKLVPGNAAALALKTELERPPVRARRRP